MNVLLALIRTSLLRPPAKYASLENTVFTKQQSKLTVLSGIFAWYLGRLLSPVLQATTQMATRNLVLYVLIRNIVMELLMALSLV